MLRSSSSLPSREKWCPCSISLSKVNLYKNLLGITKQDGNMLSQDYWASSSSQDLAHDHQARRKYALVRNYRARLSSQDPTWDNQVGWMYAAQDNITLAREYWATPISSSPLPSREKWCPCMGSCSKANLYKNLLGITEQEGNMLLLEITESPSRKKVCTCSKLSSKAVFTSLSSR